jgi:parallel beta-helix repeat protein
MIPAALGAVMLMALGLIAPANAQSRVFVAALGSDTNACTFAAPCRSFQHAHNVVAANGEIDVLDPAGYGALTITKAISVQGHGFSGITATSGNAITINAGANDQISLRGLVIEGFGTGDNGIVFNAGTSLNIQDSVIRHFTANGISFQPTAGASELNVSQTLVSDLGSTATAVLMEPHFPGSVKSVLDHVRLAHGGQGLVLVTGFSGTLHTVTIADSVVSDYGNTGIDISASAGDAQVMVRNCTVSNNGTGIEIDFSSSNTRVTKSTITGNGTGLNTQTSGGGGLFSYGDNNLDGNTINGTFTSTIAYH